MIPEIFVGDDSHGYSFLPCLRLHGYTVFHAGDDLVFAGTEASFLPRPLDWLLVDLLHGTYVDFNATILRAALIGTVVA
jgi:hypothetical protein